MKSNILKLMLSSLLLVSCNALFFGVKQPVVQKNRKETAAVLHPQIDKYELHYSLFFRTQEYVDLTKDTLLFSNRIQIFNKNGDLLQFPETCTPRTFNKTPGFSIKKMPINKANPMHINTVIQGLETENNTDATLEKPDWVKNFVVLDWNTFVIRPQRANLKSVLETVNPDSTYFIFVNKDVILTDSLYKYNYSRFNSTTPF